MCECVGVWVDLIPSTDYVVCYYFVFQANINLYTNDGFTVVSIQRVDPSPPLSTATIAGIVVGAVVGVILIVLCVLLIIYCCGCK